MTDSDRDLAGFNCLGLTMGSEIIVTPVVRIFPEWQQILIVVVGAVSGALSIVGSGLILYSILVDWERKKKEVKYRFLFGLSISDIITSLVFVAWPLPIPEGTPNVWGAMGTTQTCTLQGFLLQLSAIGVFYNGALCHWFYYSICKGMSDAVYIQKGWERNWHIFNISFAFVTACIITAVDQFNYQIMGCWISNYPYGTPSLTPSHYSLVIVEMTFAAHLSFDIFHRLRTF